jgi:hypothetical protein
MSSTQNHKSISVQQTFQKDCKLRKPYSYGPYNVVRGKRQRIRWSEGCVNNCPNCYEPTEIKIFGLPELVRNTVEFSDMNPLCKPEALEMIRELENKRVNGKVIKYEFICGIDYRFLTQEIANALFKSRFRRIRLAWDSPYYFQFTVKKAIDMLLKAGYKRRDIMVFLLCNYRIVNYEENCLKLDLCKVWNVKACDCYFDGQIGSKIVSLYWTGLEILTFRKKVRKHNQIVNFGIDPEVF